MLGLIWSKVFDTLIVFLIDFFEKVNYKKKQSIDDKKKACKITQQAKSLIYGHKLLLIIVHLKKFILLPVMHLKTAG